MPRPKVDSDDLGPVSGANSFRQNDGQLVYNSAADAVDSLLRQGLEQSTPAPEQPRSRPRRATIQDSDEEGERPLDEDESLPADPRSDPPEDDDDESDSDAEIEDQSDEDDDRDHSDDEDDDESHPPVNERRPIPEAFEVRLDDGSSVPFRELKKGYLRNRDYTVKTQELADDRKKLSDLRQNYDAQRVEYSAKLDLINRALASVYDEKPQAYWDDLRQRDPQRYVLERDADREQRERMGSILNEHNSEIKRSQDEAVARYNERLSESRRKLTEVIPAWKDPEKARADATRMRNKAVEYYGFEQNDLNGISDHRVILVLRDAIRYRDASRKASVEKKKGNSASTVTTSRPVPHRVSKDSTPTRKKHNSLIQKHTDKKGHFPNASAAVSYLLERDGQE